MCFDAKINFDDNAEFRQKEIFAMDDTSETDPIESEAAKYDLKYIGMDGNIACFGKNRSIVTDLLYQAIVHFTWLLFNRNNVILSL